MSPSQLRGDTMKLSFSIAGKSSSKSQANLKSSQKFNGEPQDQSANADKEYVTVFDPSKPTQKSKKLVIPPKQNERRPLKKMKNLGIPLAASADQDLQFEVETAVAADGGPNISYGLNLRNSDEAEPEERPSRPAPVETVMLQKLKDDLMKLPDGPGLEDNAEMQIEGFSAALLAGYGWQEGMGIGRNAKKDVKIAEYKKWVGKEGLGFCSEPPSNGSGSIKKDKEKEQSLRESKGGSRKESKRNKEKGRRTEDRGVSWLTSHIRVRIISKDLKKGRLYPKKGEIVDVVEPTTCDITMDDSRELIQGVAQDLLETALPRTGGPVLVLYGKHKGVYGNLMEKVTDNETAIVRDADSHELLSVRLEQIAEYIGNPSYLGH